VLIVYGLHGMVATPAKARTPGVARSLSTLPRRARLATHLSHSARLNSALVRGTVLMRYIIATGRVGNSGVRVSLLLRIQISAAPATQRENASWYTRGRHQWHRLRQRRVFMKQMSLPSPTTPTMRRMTRTDASALSPSRLLLEVPQWASAWSSCG